MRFPDAIQPSLQVLSYVLRHRECWPDDFEWNYGECSRCAMGLAGRLWQYDFLCSFDMADVFDMQTTAARKIFGGYQGEEFYGVDKATAITPERVADKIDEYLKTAA